MKLLILITISIASLNVFAAEVGENQKSECPYANQSSKREAKEVAPAETEVKTEEVKNVSK